MKQQLSLQNILNLSVVVGLVIAAGIISWSFRDLSSRIESQFRREADERAHLVAQLMLNALILSDYQEVQSTADNLIQHPQVVGIRVANAFGEPIVDLRPDRKYTSAYRSEVPLTNERNGIPIGTLQMEQSHDFLDHLVVVRFFVITFSVLTLGAVLLGVYLWISRTIVRFVHEVDVQFRRLMKNEAMEMPSRWAFRELSDLCRKFNELSVEMLTLRKTERDQAKLVALAEVAAQVAHDIRSPVAAIRIVSTSVPELSGTARKVLREAAERINGIAEELLRRRRSSVPLPVEPHQPEPVEVVPVLLDLIEEKRFELRKQLQASLQLVIPEGTHGLFVKADADQLKRIFSNLINNAFESMDGAGTVAVELDTDGHSVELRVRDHGKGIPGEVIPQLLRRGQTFGKELGSGLGLAMSDEWIRSYGGSLSIDSILSKGTTVTMRLPTCPTPAWHVPELILREDAHLVVLDDDPSVFDAWCTKLQHQDSATGIRLSHFCRETDLVDWLRETTPAERQSVYYLMDFELGADGEANGLDIIERLQLRENAILVTGRYSDRSVIHACERSRVPLLSKTSLPSLPIRIVPAS